MAINIYDILASWEELGVFSFLLPVLMVFALVYGILSTSNFLGENKGVNVVIALSMAILSIQFGYVQEFFATIFPYAGIGISVLLVAIILMGVVTDKPPVQKWVFFGLGALIFIIVMLYTIADFGWLGGYAGEDWVPTIIVGLLVIGALVAIVTSTKNASSSPGKG